MNIKWACVFKHGNYLASLALLLSLLFVFITVQFLPSSRASYICLQCFHVPNLPMYLVSLFLMLGMPGNIFCTLACSAPEYSYNYLAFIHFPLPQEHKNHEELSESDNLKKVHYAVVATLQMSCGFLGDPRGHGWLRIKKELGF